MSASERSGRKWMLGLGLGLGITMGVSGCGTAERAEAPSSNPPDSVAPAEVTSAASTSPGPTSPVAYDSPASLPPAATIAPATGTEAPAAGQSYSADNISLQVVDVAAYQAAVARHQGKVVLVDFWATWCSQCKEQFPHSVALGQTYRDKGLALISMSFDDSENHPNVLAFLKTQPGTTDNLLSVHGMSVESGVAFDVVGGALPYYKLYDRTGKLRYQFTTNVEGLEGVLPIEELDKRVAELIAEGA